MPPEHRQKGRDRPEDGRSGEDGGNRAQKARRREPPGEKIYTYTYIALTPRQLCGGPARRSDTANRTKKHSGECPLCLVLVSGAVAADPKTMQGGVTGPACSSDPAGEHQPPPVTPPRPWMRTPRGKNESRYSVTPDQGRDPGKPRLTALRHFDESRQRFGQLVRAYQSWVT